MLLALILLLLNPIALLAGMGSVGINTPFVRRVLFDGGLGLKEMALAYIPIAKARGFTLIFGKKELKLLKIEQNKKPIKTIMP